MPRYLQKPSVDIELKTVYITRKKTVDLGDGTVEYQTHYHLTGDAVDEDGKRVGDFNEQGNIGLPSPDKWDEDTVEADAEAVAALVKAIYVDVHTDLTITP
jgi:hypothetical protein